MTDPLDFGFMFRPLVSEADRQYKQAIILSVCGCFFGWVALEFMIIGLRISKSAVASYGEMAGLTIPFIFDALVLGRKFLSIDAIGVLLIIAVQAYIAFHKQQAANLKALEVKPDDNNFSSAPAEDKPQEDEEDEYKKVDDE